MFIISTLASQVVMTVGGSKFPGALGAMLMEILPFLRGVAIDIRDTLGDDHLGLIPTVMAAYALTSFLTGFAFIILGLLRLGTLVAYFPQTVLTGAIGAIGVSLFVLGLGLPFPPAATPLALGNVGSTLFAKSHLGILAASFFPAFLLSVTLRSQSIAKWSRGLVSSAYYIPIYLLCIPTVFWITVRSLHLSKDQLIATGWLFKVDASTSSTEIVASWNYWTLFNFKLVEWWALKSATQNIVLLVVIGVLNLPIFVPSLAFSLDVAYDMNHELIGQGAANILAGALGSLPNILQYSYSVYFTRAQGGRFELWLVVIITAGLFFTAGLILPYVPTILASGMVLFLGIELFLGATWEASETLAGMEWAVVVGTLAACTFLGFAEGFGVGIGVATAVYLIYGVIDSPARTTPCNEWHEMQHGKPDEKDHVVMSMSGPLRSQRNYMPGVNGEHYGSASTVNVRTIENSELWQRINARVVILSGYIFFASVPSLEKKLLDTQIPAEFIILDLTRAHRIETTAARCLTRCVRELELKKSTLIICGLVKDSGLHADFTRAEVTLAFDAEKGVLGKEVLVFATRAACLTWCQHQRKKLDQPLKIDDQAMDSAFRRFCHVFGFDLSAALGDPVNAALPDGTPSVELDRFIQNGGHIVACRSGQVIDPGLVFVLDGRIALVNSSPDPEVTSMRPSLRGLLGKIPHVAINSLRTRLPVLFRRPPPRTGILEPGNVFDLRGHSGISVAMTESLIVQIDGEALTGWAQAKLGVTTPIV
ncbi:hypothetical protein B0H19DRAFT_1170895 [Mycena capillaripes]|nr:hypothetical protein B0H19DRAFT_1170895 [Mycena capillaripes]